MKRIYLDYAATTPLDFRVKRAMEPWWEQDFGNAGGLYEEGRKAKEAMETSRGTIARLVGAKVNEIIFTSGGTEANNLAIFGAAHALHHPEQSRGAACPHIITTAFEHHAVLHPCQQLEKEGFSAGGGPASGWEVTYLDVGKDGVVNPADVQKALRPETILVTIMYANNEIGTIQPIAEIGKIISDYKSRRKVGTPTVASGLPYFHTDACQGAGYLDLNVNNLGVDLMSVNGSKIYGPKGVGFLYKRLGVKIKPQILGGGQELRMRSGTEAVPLIVGLAKAFEIAQEEREEESGRLIPLRDYFISEIIKRIPKVVLNGHAEKRLPNNVNVSVLDIEGEALILYLDALGISISTGSACTSESLEPSHVILALGKPYEFAHSSMRFTLGRGITKEDLDYVLEKLPEVVGWLRVVSPLNLDPKAVSMSHPEAFAGENLKVKANSKSYK